MLTDEDLAYMRETQAEVRPTEATVRIATPGGSDGMGGRTAPTLSDPEPIQVRVDDNPDVPADLAGRYDVPLVKIVADLVPMPVGSLIAVPGRTWKVVTTYDVDEWATAQVVYAVPR
jgi:hypothetical protein